jgi:CheY-like chemotaxis protein
MEIQILVIDDHAADAEALLGRLEPYFPDGVTFGHTVVDSVVKALDELRAPAKWDAVFLDIRDIDNVPGLEYTSIGRIRQIHFYIPIVMFSWQVEDKTILDYIDLGARSFIPKRDLPKTRGAFDDQHMEMIARDARKLATRIRQIVEEYRPVKRLLARSLENGTLRKSGPRGDLEDQILFLEALATDVELAAFFPRLIPGRSGVMQHAAFYEMPFYAMPHLYKCLLSHEDEAACEEFARIAVRRVIEGPFLHLTTRHRIEILPQDLAHPLFFERFEARITTAREKLRAVGDAAEPEAQDFLRLVDCKGIALGDSPLIAPEAILHEIKSDAVLLQRLKPRFLSWTHGDLHFKNILVDERLPRMMEIRLVDPRGTGLNGYPPGAGRYPLGTGDPAYDIGKLLYSSSGMSHLIQDQLFRPARGSLTFNVSGEEARVGTFEPVANERSSVPEGLSRSRLSVIRPTVRPWIWDLFKALGEYVKECVEGTDYPQQDPDWWLRARLYEALHFCSLAPMRVENDPIEATHLFLRGAELLNQFITDYRQGKLDLGR